MNFEKLTLKILSFSTSLAHHESTCPRWYAYIYMHTVALHSQHKETSNFFPCSLISFHSPLSSFFQYFSMQPLREISKKQTILKNNLCVKGLSTGETISDKVGLKIFLQTRLSLSFNFCRLNVPIALDTIPVRASDKKILY